MKNIIKPTLLDFAILGLIQNQPLSGYRIRKLFEQTALSNYSSSPGTIYPALKRMEQLGLIEKGVIKDSKKSPFQITSKGISILTSWFVKPIEKEDVEKRIDELLLRFAFMETLVDKKQKLLFLTTFSDYLSRYIKELKQHYHQQANEMPLHGKLALQHGVDTAMVTLKWCKKALIEIN
ncbi:PadR family transcriptional regulator [Muriicola sp. Z0-33]|uniref:PadR family transcriptional regulator n=1 Tax=Muriicola sp. Z0-33 TaxID=2816957 RepID=UPI0022377DD3|nr:PadR family transcriptional regulator [Muriicola sp. Z0-33]MCW5517149.1 PadR family transcriptional regulator [Muriicola sp. Z0-33]